MKVKKSYAAGGVNGNGIGPEYKKLAKKLSDYKAALTRAEASLTAAKNSTYPDDERKQGDISLAQKEMAKIQKLIDETEKAMAKADVNQ